MSRLRTEDLHGEALRCYETWVSLGLSPAAVLDQVVEAGLITLDPFEESVQLCRDLGLSEAAARVAAIGRDGSAAGCGSRFAAGRARRGVPAPPVPDDLGADVYRRAKDLILEVAQVYTGRPDIAEHELRRRLGWLRMGAVQFESDPEPSPGAVSEAPGGKASSSPRTRPAVPRREVRDVSEPGRLLGRAT